MDQISIPIDIPFPELVRPLDGSMHVVFNAQIAEFPCTIVVNSTEFQELYVWQKILQAAMENERMRDKVAKLVEEYGG